MDASDDGQKNFMKTCIICGLETTHNNYSVLTTKGCQGIAEASKQRGDNIHVKTGQRVHKDCRKKYTNPCQIKKSLAITCESNESSIAPLLRSSKTFKFSEQCLFCASSAKISNRKRGCDVFPVRTSDFQSEILAVCDERGDEWSVQVRGRIECVNDLHAADAIYHQTCSVNFRTKKDLPRKYSDGDSNTIKSKGRRSLSDHHFLKVVFYLEERKNEQVTLNDLVEKMTEYGDGDAYSDKHMRRKLIDYYGDNVMFTSQHQRSDVVTIRSEISGILRQFHKNFASMDEENEKSAIIQTAAKLIRYDIMQMESKTDFYPSLDMMKSEDQNKKYLPESLMSLLQKVIQGKDRLKAIAIGQAVTQTTRPRQLLAPIQLGLGIQLHHKFGSKFLIETLNALGFCISYSEVQRFESNAACQLSTDVQGFTSEAFLQYTADNVDHNTCTLDGTGTFHGMGIIASLTPAGKASYRVPRARVNEEDIRKGAMIRVKHYQSPSNKFNFLSFLTLRIEKPQSYFFDSIPSILWPLRSPAPGWSGTMQMCQQGGYPGKASVTFLPMIDLSPSDPSCIFSTLSFVVDHSRKYGVTPVLTFDQPLFWKATAIIENEPEHSPLKSVVLRLGGFHTQMSFLGAIGHLMRGTGLKEVIELVYATNAVDSILGGKAVSRAVRAHCLVDTALHSLLVSNICRVPQLEGHSTEDNEEMEADELLADVNHLFDTVLSGDTTVEEFCCHESLKTLEARMNDITETGLKSRTAQIWIGYMKMVSCLKTFIRAERTGNWQLHLQSVYAMLPFFAAAGHNLYLKSAYLYLMKMLTLDKEHPDVLEMFTAGHHVIRRSDRYWAGLSSDLVIEQVLMRSLKTSGGLTRGRGMTELQRARWIQAMPLCTEVNNAMMFLTDLDTETSTQHKEASTARQKRDKDDIDVLLKFLHDRDPFKASDDNLVNIESGVVAESKVNADKAEEIGMNIVKAMEGHTISSYTLKRSMQVKTMDSQVSVKIDDDVVQVDPQLLFQRLVAAARLDTTDISAMFKYELSTIPSSLFDSNGLPREPVKPQIADAIWKMGPCGVEDIPAADDILFVIDGGSLLQKIPWLKNETFSAICQRYLDYLGSRYKDAVIVFDGYKTKSSTKDAAHLRRSKGTVPQRVHFDENMHCRSKKEHFLTNLENKQDFLNMLSMKITDGGYQAIHAPADADMLIALTAVEKSSERTVVVVDEDTDLLILLLYHKDDNEGKDIFFKSDIARGKTKVWNIKKTKSILGLKISYVLPVIHALTGCDTTSRVFGLGKGVSLKKIASDQTLVDMCTSFISPMVKKDELIQSGEGIISFLCGGDINENLDRLRFRKFVQKTTTSLVTVQVHSLPPTRDSCKFHLLRTYFQVQDWIQQDSSLKPEDWGWQKTEKGLLPVRQSLPPAPEFLLKVVHCKCKQGCESKRCMCRKHGLNCTNSCSDCRGNCSNSGMCDSDAEDD